MENLTHTHDFQLLKKQIAEMHHELMNSSQNTKDAIYDNSDLIQLLKVSPRTLQTWRDKNLIGFYQVGSKIYYMEKDVIEFLEAHRVKETPSLKSRFKRAKELR